MRELLLIASAAAVMLAGFPFMKRADDFIARWARWPDAEDTVSGQTACEMDARKKAPAASRLSGMRVRRRAAPTKASHPV